MDNIEIPDDFYICKIQTLTYLCHRSCDFKNGRFSNTKNIHIYQLTNEHITILKNICNIVDEIEDQTYFIDNIFNILYFYFYNHSIQLCTVHEGHIKKFDNVSDFLEYLAKSYPECMKTTDIKIALKD
jgi:hypothetical protein